MGVFVRGLRENRYENSFRYHYTVDLGKTDRAFGIGPLINIDQSREFIPNKAREGNT